MPLLALWKADQSAVLSMNLQQIITTAGDGTLRDNSDCCSEFRAFLGSVSSEKLEEYADRCLTTSFPHSGRALQDIINEVGRRLDFDVTAGLYQGIVGGIGFDGLWVAPSGHSIVVEVKTTDTYRIQLAKIAKYRQDLAKQGIIKGESSILIIVGREDTGELEEQIRGRATLGTSAFSASTRFSGSPTSSRTPMTRRQQKKFVGS
jgi:hypothetical protein